MLLASWVAPLTRAVLLAGDCCGYLETGRLMRHCSNLHTPAPHHSLGTAARQDVLIAGAQPRLSHA